MCSGARLRLSAATQQYLSILPIYGYLYTVEKVLCSRWRQTWQVQYEPQQDAIKNSIVFNHSGVFNVRQKKGFAST